MVDDKKNLTGDQIRAQLSDTSDIVQAATVAPPTKIRFVHQHHFLIIKFLDNISSEVLQ